MKEKKYHREIQYPSPSLNCITAPNPESTAVSVHGLYLLEKIAGMRNSLGSISAFTIYQLCVLGQNSSAPCALITSSTNVGSKAVCLPHGRGALSELMHAKVPRTVRMQRVLEVFV